MPATPILTHFSPSVAEATDNHLAQASLPTSSQEVRNVAHIQEHLTSLLKLPFEKWNCTTLREAYLDIASTVLGKPSSQADYSAGVELSNRAKELMRNDSPFSRALSMMGYQLKEIEQTFESLQSYNRYRGEELMERTEQLYASLILDVIAITAAKTGDVSYLNQLLSREKGNLDYVGYYHTEGLFREISALDQESQTSIKQSLRELISSALKHQLIRDINGIVAEHNLFSSEKAGLLSTLDHQPGHLKIELTRYIGRTATVQPRPEEIELPSDKSDQTYPDLKRVRNYAINGLFTRLNSADQSVFTHYCQSIGISPRFTGH